MEARIFFGLIYWVMGFFGAFLTLAWVSPPPHVVSANHAAESGIIVHGYDPTLVRRLALVSTTTYAIDQPGGILKSANYGAIGFRGKPTIIVQDDINAALIGSTDREIIVAFRGTLLETLSFDDLIETVFDWANDTEVQLVSDASLSPGRIHKGFRNALKSLWPAVLKDVQARLGRRPLPVVLTGHSKGGALARLAALGLRKANIPVAGVYTFGAPRTGDAAFASDYNQQIHVDFRFEYADDMVPHTPPTKKDTADLLSQHWPNRRVSTQESYQHVGELQFFDWNGGLRIASPELDAERTSRLHQQAYSFHIEQIADDHSLTSSYQPKLVKLVRR